MNDETTKQRVSDPHTNEHLSTLDLADAGHDSPKKEQAKPRFADAGGESAISRDNHRWPQA